MGSHANGLSESQVELIRQSVGVNEVEHEKPLPWWKHLWLAYRTPFSLLLTVLALISYVTEDMKATIVISAMVVLATIIRFWQETKSTKAAEKLKAMVHTTATVLRRDITEEAVPIFNRYFEREVQVKPAHQLEAPCAIWCRGTSCCYRPAT